MADGKKTTDTPGFARDTKSNPRLILANLGQLGVHLDPNPLTMPDGSWRRLMNGDFAGTGSRTRAVRAEGGIRKRGGLVPWNETAMPGGGIVTAASIPLPSEMDLTPTLLMGANRDSGTPGVAWLSSTDGSTWATTITTGFTPRPMYIGAASAGLGEQPPSRAATYRRSVYYPGDDYTRLAPMVEHPPLASYQAGVGYEFGVVPTAGGIIPFQITDMLVVGTALYYIGFYAGSVAGSRVYSMDLLTGTTLEVGGTPPDPAWCVTAYQGRIWIGTVEGLSSGVGGVYSINPANETSWRFEYQNPTIGRRHVMGLAVWNGELYALGGNYNTAGVAAQISRRTAAGTWTEVFTAPVTGTDQWFCGWIDHGGSLYVGWCHATATTGARIYSTNSGTAWATALNIGTTYSLKRPGQPIEFNGDLYWPCFGPAAADASAGDDFILKRTAATGTWSQALTNTGLNGMAALYYPSL